MLAPGDSVGGRRARAGMSSQGIPADAWNGWHPAIDRDGCREASLDLDGAAVELTVALRKDLAGRARGASISSGMVFSSALGTFTGHGMPGLAPRPCAGWRRK